MILGLLFVGVFGWQLFDALAVLSWQVSRSLRVISPDGTVQTAPVLRTNFALFAMIGGQLLAGLDLIRIGKCKDAVGWGLIAVAVGFAVALES